MFLFKRLNIYFYPVKITWSFLTTNEKNKLLYLSFLRIILSFFESLTLLSIYPLVNILIDSETIFSNDKINYLYNFFNNPSKETFIEILFFSVIILLLISLILNILTFFFLKNFRVSCQNRLAKVILNKVLSKSIDWHKDKNKTKLSQYLFSDILMWSSGGIAGLINVIGIISFIFIISISFISLVSVISVFFLICIATLSFLIMFVIRPITLDKGKLSRNSSALSMQVLREILDGIKEIKLLKSKDIMVNNYLNQFNITGQSSAMLKILNNMIPIFVTTISSIGIIFTAYYMWINNFSSSFIASEMAMILVISSRAIPQVTRLTAELNQFVSISPNLELLNQLYSTLNREKLDFDSKKFNNKFDWSQITFSNIKFNYNKFQIFNDIDFTIKKNLHYGIVGESGVGKTTMMDIILGLLKPSKGNIYLDKKEIKYNDYKNIFFNFGYIPQNPLLIDGSILDNILFGLNKDNIDHKHLNYSIKSAGLLDLVKERGIDGQLGDTGNYLSGGQKQKIAIARLLYRKSQILFIDEGTRSLDKKNEKQIKDLLLSLKGKVTIIKISHNIDFFENFDEIFLLEKSKFLNFKNFVDFKNYFKS